MKEIKAFIHRHRITGVINALKESGHCNTGPASGCRNLFVFSGKGLFKPEDPQEQHYSMEMAEAVVNEFKLELLCEDDQVDQLVAIIQAAGRTGQRDAGWIYVTEVLKVASIGGLREPGI
jgi:nitrogen regulatory protein P-II 1